MIVFDTETTGLPLPEGAPLEKQPQIIEFAGIKLCDETYEEKERLEFLCKPTVHITGEITKITGITPEMVKDEKPFSANFKSLCNFFQGEKTMVAHNVAFDRKMIAFELARLGKLQNFPWPMNHTCTVEKSYGIKGRRLKLIELHEIATGEGFESAHRAMPDVEALVRCVKYLIERKQSA